ncbi:MAG: hypothetical protein HGA23_07335, partial [Bacteroidales bacterium]|nr:hypothetical protein [Bacteroidales bacterium]
MKVIIAGAGRTGAHLARFLLQQEHEGTVVEDRRMILSRIHRELPSEIIIEGNPIDPATMEKAEMANADIVAAVTTNDESLYRKLLLYRSHGITRDTKEMVHPSEDRWYNEQVALGYNYRMTDFQAALLSSQLNKLSLF